MARNESHDGDVCVARAWALLDAHAEAQVREAIVGPEPDFAALGCIVGVCARVRRLDETTMSARPL